MKRIFPVIFAASLALSGCSKSSPDEPIKQIEETKTQTDILKNKYKSYIPELVKYSIVSEYVGSDFSAVVGSTETVFIVGFLEKSKLSYKGTFKTDKNISSKIGSISVGNSNHSESIIVNFNERQITPGLNQPLKILASELVYKNSDQLLNITQLKTDNFEVPFASLKFNYNVISFFEGNQVKVYDRWTGTKMTETSNIDIRYLNNQLGYLFYDRNKLSIMKDSQKGLIIETHLIDGFGQQTQPLKELTVDNLPPGFNDVTLTDDKDDFIIVRKTGKIYKVNKITLELSK